HELGHALGLGESTGPTSAMYGTLAPGSVIRLLTTADLNVAADEAGADAQRAAPLPEPSIPSLPAVTSSVAMPTAPRSTPNATGSLAFTVPVQESEGTFRLASFVPSALSPMDSRGHLFGSTLPDPGGDNQPPSSEAGPSGPQLPREEPTDVWPTLQPVSPET